LNHIESKNKIEYLNRKDRYGFTPYNDALKYKSFDIIKLIENTYTNVSKENILELDQEEIELLQEFENEVVNIKDDDIDW